jgi:hypothetical protein
MAAVMALSLTVEHCPLPLHPRVDAELAGDALGQLHLEPRRGRIGARKWEVRGVGADPEIALLSDRVELLLPRRPPRGEEQGREDQQEGQREGR